MNNYYLYVRKSTDVEDKQVRSIDDQLAVLRKLAKEENINIVEEFVEKQSAKTPGRPIFNEMLNKIEHGGAQGIICWKLDRLARNPIDGGQISWMLQKGILQHIRTFERSYYPQDNVLIMSVEFGMANQYILDLRTNTKRGLMEKIRRKEYPSLAPVGYLNDTRTKMVVVDSKKASLVKEAFELYAQNNSRLEDIAVFFFQHGVVTRGGKPFPRIKVAWILSNPFYYGLFRYAGELYEGKHKPIISKKLFDKVQTVLQQRGKPQKPHQESLELCGLFHCGNCGMMITGGKRIKRQKNDNIHEYTYYHCTRKSKTVKCLEPVIAADELDRQLSSSIKNFALPHDWARELFAMSEKDEQQTRQSSAALIRETKQEIEVLTEKIQRLLAVYLEEDIDRDTYHQEKANLLLSKKSLEEKIKDLEQGTYSWIKPLQEWLKDAENIGQIAISPSLGFKKSVAQKIFGLNLFLQNRKVTFTPQNQWASLRDALENSKNSDVSLVLVEMARVKLASKSHSQFTSSQD